MLKIENYGDNNATYRHRTIVLSDFLLILGV